MTIAVHSIAHARATTAASPDSEQVPDRPIRVLFINDHLGFPGGVTHGSTTYLSSILPAFDRRRVDARLCICRDRHAAAERFEEAGVPLVFLGRAKWDPRVFTDMLSLIRRWDIDVVHLNGQKSHLLGRLAARLLRRRAIIHLHMLYAPRPRWLQVWLARRTDAALGVSQAMRDWAIEAFGMEPGRTSTLYNGVELERFMRPPAKVRRAVRAELGLAPATPVAVVVGRVTTKPDKGQRLAIEAFRTVLRQVPDAVLLIVGDGPARRACEAHAEALGISDAVRFLGHRSDVERLYAAADLAVVPSVVDEAFCYAALEALASSRPVVAFDGGGVPELVRDGETGVLVRTGDVDGLAAGVARLLGDPLLRGRLGENGRTHAEQFGVAPHVERLETLYRSLTRPS